MLIIDYNEIYFIRFCTEQRKTRKPPDTAWTDEDFLRIQLSDTKIRNQPRFNRYFLYIQPVFLLSTNTSALPGA